MTTWEWLVHGLTRSDSSQSYINKGRRKMLKLKNIYLGDLKNTIAVFNYTDLDKNTVFDKIQESYDLLEGIVYWSGDMVLALRSLFSEISEDEFIEKVEYMDKYILLTDSGIFELDVKSNVPFITEKFVVANPTEATDNVELVGKFKEFTMKTKNDVLPILNAESLIIDTKK